MEKKLMYVIVEDSNFSGDSYVRLVGVYDDFEKAKEAEHKFLKEIYPEEIPQLKEADVNIDDYFLNEDKSYWEYEDDDFSSSVYIAPLALNELDV